MTSLVADARVTVAQVTEIISTKLSVETINACINTAHYLVDAKLASTGLGADLLNTIELWLSAHFVAIRDPRAESESVAEYSVKFQGRTDMGLKATTYGQQALALDYTGTLASMGLQKATLNMI
ncbi:MAG: hypothetical protein EHM48_01755 [Planctomycetaceae bacterium]|nr:MAG: hypothetical protein EHM48_01755 [Planctomycetaceae bacterium]